MITESKVTEIFCIADDFCKEYEVEMAKNALPSSASAPERRRKRMMSDAEVITILITRVRDNIHQLTYRLDFLGKAVVLYARINIFGLMIVKVYYSLWLTRFTRWFTQSAFPERILSIFGQKKRATFL